MNYISDLLPQYIFQEMIHGKPQDKPKDQKEIQFRNSSEIIIKKSTCSCSNKNVNQNISS